MRCIPFSWGSPSLSSITTSPVDNEQQSIHWLKVYTIPYFDISKIKPQTKLLALKLTESMAWEYQNPLGGFFTYRIVGDLQSDDSILPRGSCWSLPYWLLSRGVYSVLPWVSTLHSVRISNTEVMTCTLVMSQSFLDKTVSQSPPYKMKALRVQVFTAPCSHFLDNVTHLWPYYILLRLILPVFIKYCKWYNLQFSFQSSLMWPLGNGLQSQIA